MRFNMPLMPIKIIMCFQMNVRWRPLPAFRFSVRAMMLVVAITAVFFSAWIWFQAHLVRLARANNYHAEQAFNPFLTGVVDRPWHAKMYNEYHAAIVWNSMIATTLLTIISMTLLIAIIGRVMNWLYLRSHTPSQSGSPNTTPVVRPAASHAP